MPIGTEKYCSSCGTPNPINYIDESVKVSRTKVVRKREKRHEAKPTRVIAISIVVAIGALVATFFANTYALNNMQYRVNDVSAFDYSSLTSDVVLEACNPTAMPVAFDKFSAVVNYRQGELGRIEVSGGTVMPYQASTFPGELKLSARIISGLIIALAGSLAGNDSPYDENDITLIVTTEAKILGIIPHSESREFTFAEFQQFMSSQQAEQYQCG
jgi:hypothetical protein